MLKETRTNIKFKSKIRKRQSSYFSFAKCKFLTRSTLLLDGELSVEPLSFIYELCLIIVLRPLFTASANNFGDGNGDTTQIDG